MNRRPEKNKSAFVIFVTAKIPQTRDVTFENHLDNSRLIIR